jgi:phosphate-selective porin OprO/OprP
MNTKYFLRISLLLVLVALFPYMAQAQNGKCDNCSPDKSSDKPSSATDDANRKSDRVDKVDELKAKLEQLESVIEQQRRALAEMQKSIDALTSNSAALKKASATSSIAEGAPAQPPVEIEAIQDKKSDLPNSTDPKGQGGNGKTGTTAAGDKGPTFLRSPDGKFDASLITLGQFDYRGYSSGNHPPNTFAIRRARIGVQGNFLRYYDYKIEAEFSDARSTLLRDLWFGMNRTDWFRVRVGHFREPFSQERLIPANSLDFTERSLVFNLAPDRSPGIMFFGSISKGEFEYQLGAFNGRGLLANNDEGTPETTLRLRFSPWKNDGHFWTKGLSFGGAYTHGRTRNGISVTGITESRSFTYFAPDTVNGKIDRANAEMTWMLGPAAFRAEYDQTNEQRENLGPSGTNLPGVIGKGYMAQFTYLLTGETKPETGLFTPRHSLFGESGAVPGFGAWEVKARYSNLQIADATAKSNRADTIYVGFNWYLNRYVKQVFDLGIERFKDPSRTPIPGDRNFLVVLSRLQVAF